MDIIVLNNEEDDDDFDPVVDRKNSRAFDDLFGEYESILNAAIPIEFVEKFEDPRDNPDFNKEVTITRQFIIHGSILVIENRIINGHTVYSVHEWTPYIAAPEKLIGVRNVFFDLGHMYVVINRGIEVPLVFARRLKNLEIDAMVNRYNWANFQPPVFSDEHENVTKVDNKAQHSMEVDTENAGEDTGKEHLELSPAVWQSIVQQEFSRENRKQQGPFEQEVYEEVDEDNEEAMDIDEDDGDGSP